MSRPARLIAFTAVAAVLAGCGGRDDAAPVVTLSGCLERGRAGDLLVMTTDVAVPAPLARGHVRRVVIAGDSGVDLEPHVGRRVTVEGALREVDAIVDPGTQAPAAGRGADSSQIEEENVTGITVRRLQKVGMPCRESP